MIPSIEITKAIFPTMQSIGSGGLSEVKEDIDLEFLYEGTLYRMRSFNEDVIDGASIPWFLWSPLRLYPHGKMDGPALWHDIPYHYTGEMPFERFQFWSEQNNKWLPVIEPMSRKFADALLYHLCKWFGIKKRAYIIWTGVRSGGWWAWNRNDKARLTKKIRNKKTNI